jgi:hypothetical protein
LLPGGAGQGQTTDIEFTNNYCQVRGDAAVALNDIQHVTIADNEIHEANHAWSLINNSTGVAIDETAVAPTVKYEVGIDESSKPGYHGPPAGGAP